MQNLEHRPGKHVTLHTLGNIDPYILASNPSYKGRAENNQTTPTLEMVLKYGLIAPQGTCILVQGLDHFNTNQYPKPIDIICCSPHVISHDPWIDESPERLRYREPRAHINSKDIPQGVYRFIKSQWVDTPTSFNHVPPSDIAGYILWPDKDAKYTASHTVYNAYRLFVKGTFDEHELCSQIAGAILNNGRIIVRSNQFTEHSLAYRIGASYMEFLLLYIGKGLVNRAHRAFDNDPHTSMATKRKYLDYFKENIEEFSHVRPSFAVTQAYHSRVLHFARSMLQVEEELLKNKDQ